MSMRAKLRVGLVGVGAIATVHWEAYRDVSNVQVVAAADSDPSRIDFINNELSIHGYSSLAEMLAREDLDIVCILTPPAAHEAATLQCAASKVHVLCEKPMALSVASCERMIAACAGAGVRLCYGASYRYLPALMAARELILSGRLGDILLLREYAVGGNGIESRQTLSEAHYPTGGPGGSGMGLVDHGVHLIDAFSWLMDSRIIAAHGRGNVTGERQGPEFATLEFANGAVGQLLYEDGTFPSDLPHEGMFSAGAGWGVNGRVAPGEWQPHPSCIHVHGTHGALRIFHYANALFCMDAAGAHQIKIMDRPMPGNFALQMETFANAIRLDQPTPVPGEAGAEACRVLQEIYDSQLRNRKLATV